MHSFRPWDGTVRILTGGWGVHPVRRGEYFAEADSLPIVNVVRDQKLFAFLLFIAFWLPKHITR